MQKRPPRLILFVKSHISGYTRADGTFVAAHEDKRAAAAKDGFDVENTYFHYSHDPNIEGVSEGKGRFGGLFALKDRKAAANYGPHGHEFAAKGPVFDNSEFQDAIDDRRDEVESWIKEELGDDGLDDEALDDVIWLIQDESNAGSEPPNKDGEALMSAMRAVDDSDLYAEAQKLRGKIARRLGASAIHMNDEFGKDSVMLLSKDNVRHIGKLEKSMRSPKKLLLLKSKGVLGAV